MESSLISTPISGGSSTIKKFYSVKTSQNSSALDDGWTNQKESNASKLDTLLQDLKNERELTRENNYHTTNNMEEYDSLLRDTKQYYPTNQNATKHIYTKEEILSDNIPIEERYNTINSLSSYREQAKTRDLQEDALLNYNASKNYFSNRQDIIQSNDIIQSADFNKLQLSEDILPIPGTKVTTTVRTYTYEVPTDGAINRDVVIKDVSHETSNTLNTSPPVARGKVIISNEIDQNSNNYSYEEHINRASKGYVPLPNTKKTIKYSATSQEYVDENIPSTPLRDNKFSQCSNTKRPLVDISNNTYYYNSKDSNNQTSYNNQSPTQKHIVGHNSPKSIEYRVESTSQVRDAQENSYIPNSSNNSVIMYKYSNHATRNHQGQPVSLIQPFPVYDENDGTGKYLQPPKHLNELLTNLNETNTNVQTVIDGYNPKLEVETAVAKENANKVIVHSKNVAGPPVYYPPNHEMTLRKEEKSAAYRAGGGWARARGEYEYEAESRSKSKTKSGGAVVPVCLPLCCAMPCSIM